MNEKPLPVMYSAVFWCLLVLFLFFWLYCITTVTPFKRRSQGWSFLSGCRVLDQSQQKCRFFAEIQIHCKFFQLQPERETSFSSLKEITGSFSIDDGNGSENVPFKLNSRFFNLCRLYSNLVKMSNVGEFPWS